MANGIEWNVVATIAAPIVALLLGVVLDRAFGYRPKLIMYFGHSSATRLVPDPPAQPFSVHSHSLFVRNNGRAPARNVRISHAVLTNFSVWPQVPYQVNDLPQGGREIVFPVLLPRQTITITYIYFPPVVFTQFRTGVQSDECIAKGTTVFPAIMPPIWFLVVSGLAQAIGIITVLYLGYIWLHRALQ